MVYFFFLFYFSVFPLFSFHFMSVFLILFLMFFPILGFFLLFRAQENERARANDRAPYIYMVWIYHTESHWAQQLIIFNIIIIIFIIIFMQFLEDQLILFPIFATFSGGGGGKICEIFIQGLWPKKIYNFSHLMWPIKCHTNVRNHRGQRAAPPQAPQYLQSWHSRE